MGSLAEKKLTVWQKRIWKLKSAETDHGQHSPFPPYFARVFSHFCFISAIYTYFSSIFACFLAISQPFFPNFNTGRTVWHNSMEHQPGRTELENLAPPERISFWQNRIKFWQKDIVAPPKKCPRNAYGDWWCWMVLWHAVWTPSWKSFPCLHFFYIWRKNGIIYLSTIKILDALKT